MGDTLARASVLRYSVTWKILFRLQARQRAEERGIQIMRHTTFSSGDLPASHILQGRMTDVVNT